MGDRAAVRTDGDIRQCKHAANQPFCDLGIIFAAALDGRLAGHLIQGALAAQGLRQARVAAPFDKLVRHFRKQSLGIGCADGIGNRGNIRAFGS